MFSERFCISWELLVKCLEWWDLGNIILGYVYVIETWYLFWPNESSDVLHRLNLMKGKLCVGRGLIEVTVFP